MLIKRTFNILCNKCKSRYSVPRLMLASTHLDDELPKAIKSGQFFKCTCPKCGQIDRFSYPLLYLDTRYNALIQVIPDKVDATKDVFFDIMHSLEKECSSFKYVRLVQNYLELAEKITAFEQHRDDRIIELCKIYYRIVLKEKQPSFNTRHVYYYVTDKGQEAFSFSDDNGNFQRYLLNVDDYMGCYYYALDLDRRFSNEIKIDYEFANIYFSNFVDSLETDINYKQEAKMKVALDLFGPSKHSDELIDAGEQYNKAYSYMRDNQSLLIPHVFCAKCGAEIDENDRFCFNCGHPQHSM